jgi:hypothetical protein
MTPETPSARHTTNWEKVSGLVAIVIGVAALLLSAFTAYLEHKHAKAELWPQVRPMWDDTNGFRRGVVNQGTGPALIRDVRVTFDGHTVRTWREVVQGLLGEHAAGHGYGKSTLAYRTLSPGDGVHMFETQDELLAKAMTAGRTRVLVTVCYCSVFDDCWRMNDGDDSHGPIRADRCDDSDPDMFYGYDGQEREALRKQIAAEVAAELQAGAPLRDSGADAH